MLLCQEQLALKMFVMWNEPCRRSESGTFKDYQEHQRMYLESFECSWDCCSVGSLRVPLIHWSVPGIRWFSRFYRSCRFFGSLGCWVPWLPWFPGSSGSHGSQVSVVPRNPLVHQVALVLLVSKVPMVSLVPWFSVRPVPIIPSCSLVHLVRSSLVPLISNVHFHESASHTHIFRF